jgi:hypothetical protein
LIVISFTSRHGAWDVLSAEQGQEPPGNVAVDERDLPAALAHPEHGLHLVHDPSGDVVDGAPGPDLLQGLLRDLGDELRVGVGLGVVGVEAVDVGHEHDRVRFEYVAEELHQLVPGADAEALGAVHEDVAEQHGHDAHVGERPDRLGVGGDELAVVHDEAGSGGDGDRGYVGGPQLVDHHLAEVAHVVLHVGDGRDLVEVDEALVDVELLGDDVPEGPGAVRDDDALSGLGDLAGQAGHDVLAEGPVLGLVGDHAAAEFYQYHHATNRAHVI